MWRWIGGKYGDLISLLAFVLVMGGVYVYDRQKVDEIDNARRERENTAERRAAFVADRMGNAVGMRLGAMSSGEITFTDVQDSISRRTLFAALDTITNRYPGLLAISPIYPGGYIARGAEAMLGTRGMDLERDTIVGNAFRRAQRTGSPAATTVITNRRGRRVVVFNPIRRSHEIVGYLAAELDPNTIYRSVIADREVRDSLQASDPAIVHSVYGPNGEPININNMPVDWPIVQRPIGVADTKWQVAIAYAPIDDTIFQKERAMLWGIGTIFALALAVILLLLRRTIARQREEIGLRQAAEQAARTSALEARERAREARELAVQLEAAQRASQRLSTSLNPEDVVELFLGALAEILNADVASLYTFEEEGEVVVGRRRIVFRNVGPITQRLQQEDIRNVRAPVSMLPTIAESVATGEPYVDTGESAHVAGGRPVPAVAGTTEAAATSVTLPLQIGGHMVGVASWEIYGERREITRAMLTFAQALAAPAAAALRTAELFATVEEERALAAREALRFTAVIDQMADGVIVVDEHGRVERSNKTAIELYGPEIETLPIEEWVTRFGITTPEGKPIASAEFPLVRALRGERVRRMTFIVHSAWGVERFLNASAGPIITSGGQQRGAAIVMRDVSDEHQYAEMLRHTNRELRRQAEVMEQVNTQLREATKAKDQFLAVMSHELRTPINAIMGYSDLLDLGVKGQLNDDQRGMINRVRDTSRHLLGLINEVLDLAKIGAGRIDLVMAELDVRHVIERAVQQIQPLANAKDLKLEAHGPDGEDVIVFADETRLTQIVINLLSNAVKFTQEGGVTIRHSVVGDKVEMRVRDTGPGIAAEQQERIFEEFYQVEGGLSRSSGGTGLGLAIARRFARLMGGDITVDSTVGKGSEFTVTLPSARAQAEEASGSLKVVMLARSESTIASVSNQLGQSARLSATTDPSMAAAITRREMPEIVLLDACAPDYAAWRALSSLQPDGGLDGTRIILMAQDQESPNVIEIGVFGILTKPLFVERATEGIREKLQDPANDLILIADEDPHARQILSEALTGSGCKITSAADGTEALRVASARRPALIVLSLTLRGMDGVATLASLRSNPAMADVEVLMLVPRELTNEQMDSLQNSVGTLTNSGEVPIRPLIDIIRQALDSDSSRNVLHAN